MMKELSVLAAIVGLSGCMSTKPNSTEPQLSQPYQWESKGEHVWAIWQDDPTKDSSRLYLSFTDPPADAPRLVLIRSCEDSSRKEISTIVYQDENVNLIDCNGDLRKKSVTVVITTPMLEMLEEVPKTPEDFEVSWEWFIFWFQSLEADKN